MTWSAEWMEGHEVDGKPGYKGKRYKLYKKEELWLAIVTTEHFNKIENSQVTLRQFLSFSSLWKKNPTYSFWISIPSSAR